LSRQELAGRLGVAHKTITAVEDGEHVPSVVLSANLARALETPIDGLFELASPPPSAPS